MKKGRKERRNREEGRKGGIGNGNWKYERVQPLWKMVFLFFNKLNINYYMT